MHSMTGFAVTSGSHETRRWRWEGRSVNGRGLDLRLRLPDGFESMESTLRGAASRQFSRGNISLSLRFETGESAPPLRLDHAALDAVLDAAVEAAKAASARGLAVAPADITGMIGTAGVLAPAPAPRPDANKGLARAISGSFDTLLTDLAAARAEEGAAIKKTLIRLVDEIEALVAIAIETEAQSTAPRAARLKDRVAALLANGADIAPERLAEELALIAVKADVTEEIDRLSGHITAARVLFEASGPIGRKLDFLTQEFNREANTLCAKSASSALTETGLALKITIDRLREQAQNVE